MTKLQQDADKAVTQVLDRYPVKRAAFFGSFARAEASDKSDADILVEFFPGTKGLEFFGLKVDLEEALDRSVDLLTFNALRFADTAFRDAVESEAVVIYERK